MRTVSIGLSDVGQRRPHNEDAFTVDDELGLYVVADGVGGRAKGEIASAEAVEQVSMWISRHVNEIDKALSGTPDEAHLFKVCRIIESGVQQACYFVFGLAEQDPGKKGMSTTMSVLVVRNGHAFVAQVGDSRVYRLRQDGLFQLTEDHTLINYKLKHGLITEEQAKTAPGKNVITRAVGNKEYVQVDIYDEVAMPGDRYLLCTDGLHNYFPDAGEIAVLMNTDPIATAAERAVSTANERGGSDNITVAIIEVGA